MDGPWIGCIAKLYNLRSSLVWKAVLCTVPYSRATVVRGLAPQSESSGQGELSSSAHPFQRTQDALAGKQRWKLCSGALSDRSASATRSIFPSHILHHVNSPLLDGETRGSMTMNMSSNVAKWKGDGGRACDPSDDGHQAYRQQCREAWSLFKPMPALL